jgi:hypothetical protein
MISIYLSGKNRREGHTFDSFTEKFLSICNSHHKEQNALAFAFILYDFLSPQINKVLNDPDYWEALNSLSGKYLTVFSFHQPSHIRQNRRYEKTFLDVNAFIEKAFGSTQEAGKPSLLFFQVNNGEVVGSCAVKIESEKIEDAFLEIKGILTDAVSSIKNVQPEYFKNRNEIFNLMVNQMSQRKTIKVIKDIVGNIKAAKDVVGLLHLI